MINFWNKIKEIVAIVTFISAAVTFTLKTYEEKKTRTMWEKKLTDIENSINGLEDFQHNQITINAVDKTQIETLKEIILVLAP